MNDEHIAALISEIRRLLWQQKWEQALAKCQEVMDDPKADEQAIDEVQELRRSIEIKARAEATIRQTLATVDQALKEPSPNYGKLLDRLKSALELGNQHYIQRWHSQLLARTEDVRSRQDIYVRYEVDHRQFREALQAGNHELALEIAQRLLDDALMHQQPAMAESVRKWIQEIGDKVRLEHLANTILSALEREDFVWACDLFERLPAMARQYEELAPRVEQAKNDIGHIEQELQDAQARWTENKPNEAAQILGDLQRRYRKSRLWRPLWRQFYNEQAYVANGKGDEAIILGEFIKAGQHYHRAELAFSQLLGVFEDDPTLLQSKEMAGACKNMCEMLAEAADARERGDLAAARAACSRAIKRMESSAPHVQEAVSMLKQRAGQFLQSLDPLELALDEFKVAELAPADSDAREILQRIDRILALGPDLPSSLRRRAEELRVRTQARHEKAHTYLQKARECQSNDPHQAAENYRQAWLIERIPEVQREITQFMQTMAENEPDYDKKRHWLEGILLIDPDNTYAPKEILLISKRPSFDNEWLPLHSRLEALEGQADPPSIELEAVKEDLAALAGQVKAVDELLSIVKQDQAKLEKLVKHRNEAQEAINHAFLLKTEGKWEEAIASLNKVAGKIDLDSQKSRLRDVAHNLKTKWDQAAQLHQAARESFDDVLKAHQAAAGTHEYGAVLQMARQSSERLQAAFSMLEGAPPAEWTQLGRDLSAFEQRARALQGAWEASLDPSLPLAGLVKDLRLQNFEKPDPVMMKLIEELTQRAVSECIAKAEEAVQDDREEMAIEALQTALDLGGEQPALRAQLDVLGQRRARRARMAALGIEIQNFLNRRGGLRTAARLQAELLELTVKDTGQPAWIEAVERLIATISPQTENTLASIVEKHRDTGSDVSQELSQAREAYSEVLRTAEEEIDRLRQLLPRTGNEGPKVLEEGEKWLYYKNMLRLYNVATSTQQVGDYVQSAKNFERLRDAASVDAPEYAVWDDDFNQACDNVVHNVKTSAEKRLTEAQTHMDDGNYPEARAKLEEIITQFYEPVERDLPALRARLMEVGTPLGDIRIVTDKRLLEAKRLAAIDDKLKQVTLQVQSDLKTARVAAASAEKAREAIYQPGGDRESAEREVNQHLDLLKQGLDEALDRVRAAELDDPGRLCFRQWQQLGKLAEQIRAYQAEQENARARRIIREAEAEMYGMCTDEDYQAIKLRLQHVNTDALGAEDKTRHKALLEKLEEQSGLPALVRLADQALNQKHYGEAHGHYERALAIRLDLGRDAGFAQRMASARAGAQRQQDIDSLVSQAVNCEPSEAIRLLEQAHNKAEHLGLEPQMQSIQRSIYRAKAREAIIAADRALGAYQDNEARRKADMALRFADRCDDQASREEAQQILKEVEDRYEKVGQVVHAASGLLEGCNWQQALDLLRSLPAEDPLVRSVLERAEAGRDQARKIEREIRTLVDGGRFDEAFSSLARASIDLAVSDQDAERLHLDIQSIQDQMSSSSIQIEALIHRITTADAVRSAELEQAISEAKALADDTHIVKGLRDEAMQLVRSLGQLKKQLEAITRAVSKAEQQGQDWTAILATLHDIPEALTLRLAEQEFKIRHHAAEAVRQKRREALTWQLVVWKSQLESLDNLPNRALQDLMKRCEDSRQYTSNPDELAQLDDVRSRIELSLEQRNTEDLCLRWQEQLTDARRLWAADDVGQALIMIQTVQNNVEAQKARSRHAQTWPQMSEVWEQAVRLRNEIDERYEKDLDLVLQRAHAAAGESSETIVRSEQECEQLLQDPQLSPSSRTRVEAVRQELTSAKAELKEAEGKLAQARGEIRAKRYFQAAETLSMSHLCPRPLRPQWDALSRVVSELHRTEMLLEGDADLMANAASLDTQLGAGKDALQRCQDLDDNWPTALSGELWMHDLHGEMKPLMGRICRALCETIERLANLALNNSNPNEAERLVAMARNEEWITEDYQDRMEDIEHETAVVRAMASVESALVTQTGDPQAASQDLANLLIRTRAVNSQRRERAVGLQRLVEVRQLLEQGNLDIAEARMNDTRLMDWFPAVFPTINREVNLAVKDRQIVNGLISHADRLIFAPPGADLGDVSNWLPEFKRRADEGHPKLKTKLQAVQDHVRQEVDAARGRGDYARLRALNALAQTLKLGERDIAGLESERKQRLQEEIEQARQAIDIYAPEMAETHIDMAKRLSEQDSGEAQELAKRLKEIRRTCAEVDQLLSEAEVFVRRLDYQAAAEKYQQASQRAPKRATVLSFEKLQHETLWQALESAGSRDDFALALATTENALRFGFMAGDWLEARRGLEQRRDHLIIELVAKAAGPGYTAGKSVDEWQGLLSDPDADLDMLQKELERALTWKPDSAELNHLLGEVKRRLKGVGDVRLDVRNGWLALEQGDYSSASQHFSFAQMRLGREHPEIVRWQRYTRMVAEAAQSLATAEIDIENVPGGGHRVVCPGWEKSSELLTSATKIFAEPKRSTLLGIDGEAAQRRQREQAMAHHRLTIEIAQQMLAMQECFDEEKWIEAKQYVDGANENLKNLHTQLSMGMLPLPSAAESPASFPMSETTETVGGDIISEEQPVDSGMAIVPEVEENIVNRPASDTWPGPIMASERDEDESSEATSVDTAAVQSEEKAEAQTEEETGAPEPVIEFVPASASEPPVPPEQGVELSEAPIELSPVPPSEPLAPTEQEIELSDAPIEFIPATDAQVDGFI